jgi:hypothetical protein
MKTVQRFSFGIAIEGDTTSIPTPALLPGLVGFGLSVWRKRKAEA